MTSALHRKFTASGFLISSPDIGSRGERGRRERERGRPIPEERGPVLAPAREEVASAAEGKARHAARVTAEGANGLPGRHGPDAHGGVVGAREHELPVGGEGEAHGARALDASLVRREFANLTLEFEAPLSTLWRPMVFQIEASTRKYAHRP